MYGIIHKKLNLKLILMRIVQNIKAQTIKEFVK